MSIELVRTTDTDWQEVGQIESRSDSQFFKAFTTQEELVKYLNESKVFFIISNGVKIGTVGYRVLPEKTAYIDGLNILPEHRKQGFAQQAMDQIFKLIGSEGFVKMELAVHPENLPALFFYLKNGFVITGYKENYWGDGEPRLIMEKTI